MTRGCLAGTPMKSPLVMPKPRPGPRLALSLLGAAICAALSAWGGWLPLLAASIIAALLIAGHFAFRLYAQRLRELNELNASLVSCLAIAIDARDPCTNGHIQRVRYYASEVGRRLGLPPAELEALRVAALLHDVGKLGIPDHLLRKPGKLSASEYALVKRHVAIGNAILRPVPFEGPVIEFIATHHERFDGRGYPHGLQRDQIPLGGRILAVVDVFDALTSDRPYRRALTREEALAILRDEAGAHFDPDVVEALAAAEPFSAPAQDDDWRLAAHLTEDLAAAEAQVAREAIPHERIPALMLPLWQASEGRPPSAAALADTALRQLGALIPYTTAAVYLLDDDGRLCHAVAVAGRFSERLRDMVIHVGEGAAGWVVQHGEPCVDFQPLLDTARRSPPDENIELSSGIALPLRSDNTMLGCLALYHTAYNFYGHDQLGALLEVAGHLAGALATRHALAGVDARTGLPDARALTQCLVELARHDVAGALLLCRCSSASQVELIVPVLCDATGETSAGGAAGFLARYGETDLALVLVGIAEDELGRLGEGVRREALAIAARHPGGDIAVGWAIRPADGRSPAELMETAARRAGRLPDLEPVTVEAAAESHRRRNPPVLRAS